MFVYKESIPAYSLRNTNNQLKIDSTQYIEYKLIRLLLGTINFEKEDGEIVYHRRNYSQIPFSDNNRQALKIIKDAISPNNLDDLKNFLHKSNSNNRGIILEILTEFTYFINCSNEDKHTQAFLHLYRTFEFISFSFPLIHASISRNYKGTYSMLKSYFKNNSNEISFLDKFTRKFLESDVALDTIVDVPVRIDDPQAQTQLYNTIKNICVTEAYLSFDDQNEIISYEYKETFKLFYYLRNRYFHFAIGSEQNNISTNSIKNPDYLFKQFNEGFANWIVYLYIEILRVQIERWK